MKNSSSDLPKRTVAKANQKLFFTILTLAFSVLFMAFIFPVRYFTDVNDNPFLKELRGKLTTHSSTLSEERVYLHFDKPMYEPGDDIWFSAYLTDASTMKPGKKSDILHVEFIDPKGTTIKNLSLIAHGGKAAGDIALSEDVAGGIYKIRAYTNWMKNKSEQNYFEREIQIQDVVLPKLKMKLDFERKAFGPGDEVIAKLQIYTNDNKPFASKPIRFMGMLQGAKLLEKSDKTDEEGLAFIRFSLPKKLISNDGLLNVLVPFEGSTESVSRSIPIVLNKIRLDFFPEGGDLVNGISTRLAFRALNEFGKPADIEGEVINKQGKKMAEFSSFHQGMGAFPFTPVAGERYTVKITKPEGMDTSYMLPDVADRGYVLGADNTHGGELALTIGTTEKEELSLVVQMRGKAYYTNAVNVVAGQNRVLVPTNDMPSGVAQVTLFDSRGTARCERLVFLNKHRRLNVSLTTEKEKYLPREKIRMNITVKDERGFFVPANLSLAVVNDQFLSFADDKNGNLLSQLLLEQDLREKVEEPAFYFDASQPKADPALDYLMMTAGWRHFTWEQILAEDMVQPTHQPEKAIISGVVYDGMTHKPVPFAQLKITKGKEIKTDTNGRFQLKHIDLYDALQLQVNASGYQEQQQMVYEYNENLTIYLFDKKYYQTRVLSDVQMDREGLIPEMAGNVFHFNAVAEDVMEVAVVEKKKAERPAAKNNRNRNENEKNNHKNLEEVVIEEGFAANAKMDTVVLGRFGKAAFKNEQGEIKKYYRARKFQSPVYKNNQEVEERTDFRTTLYWNPSVEVNKSGNAVVEFYAGDDITSYRAVVEGIGSDGNLGHSEKTIYTQLPFQLSTKLPVEVVTEDLVSIPVTLKNNTEKPLGGSMFVKADSGLRPLSKIEETQTIMPGASKTIYLDYRVVAGAEQAEISIAFQACGLKDAMTQRMKIISKGFPQRLSFSGQEREKTHAFLLSKPVTGSLKINVTVYPNVVSDLLKGIEGILREPYGCFEQTSMSSYPNAMVLDYLRSTDQKDDKLLASATRLLDKGYNRLITFETKEKGYEWFGSNPGHEALTAYGLMQFADMKRVGGGVSASMMDRTAEWLMARRDGKGGFSRNSRALDNFGRASETVTNAYIVYALSEAGYTDIKKEFTEAYETALKSNDVYELALVCNAAYNLNETQKAKHTLDLLVKKQSDNGSFDGAKHSITYSQGHSLLIESTSLAALAMMKSNEIPQGNLISSMKWLVGARDGYGSFGNTQGTVLALKALTAYAKQSKKVSKDGMVTVFIDGKKAVHRNYKAGDKGALVLEGLEKYVNGEGNHSIGVKYDDKESALPYSVSVTWNTNSPMSQNECAVDLKTKLLSTTVKVGETVRLQAILTNKKQEGLPSTMVVLGIPSGFTVQPWQLKELQEKKVMDYYEIIGNTLAIYYRCMEPAGTKEINLDLKAEVAGEFEASASAAYLYYTNELKSWAGLDKITVSK